jgi:hypothetical protein
MRNRAVFAQNLVGFGQLLKDDLEGFAWHGVALAVGISHHVGRLMKTFVNSGYLGIHLRKEIEVRWWVNGPRQSRASKETMPLIGARRGDILWVRVCHWLIHLIEAVSD